MSQDLNNNGNNDNTVAPVAPSEEETTALTTATTTFIKEMEHITAVVLDTANLEQTTAIILDTEDLSQATAAALVLEDTADAVAITPAAVLKANPILKQLLEQPCKFKTPGAMDKTGEEFYRYVVKKIRPITAHPNYEMFINCVGCDNLFCLVALKAHLLPDHAEDVCRHANEETDSSSSGYVTM